MSWLARSLVNSLRADHGESSDDDDEASNGDRSHEVEAQPDGEEHQPGTPTRGVKEDLSELTQTLTRQFWGVASFLAPPPPDPALPDHGGPSDDAEEDDELPTFAAIRSDLAEIGGRVRSGISVLSSNKAVSEISKIASTFFGSEEEDEVEAVGVTDEVLAFVRNVSLHPETWLDFPLPPEDNDSDDFLMSDAQEEHALAIERLVPSLAALRIELCPSHMSEGSFWKVYFVLLHPRFNEHDAELLSTPQIVQARVMLLQDLPIRTRSSSGNSEIDSSPGAEVAARLPPGENPGSPSVIPEVTTPTKAHTLSFMPSTEIETDTHGILEVTTPNKPQIPAAMPSPDTETDKHPIESTEVNIVEKSVIEEEPAIQVQRKDIDIPSESSLGYEEDGDGWLDEESGETGVLGDTTDPLDNEEDVSFSDLEADDDGDEEDGDMQLSSKSKSRSPTKESDWVPVRSGSSSRPQTRGSNDWLDVDIDAM